MTPYDVGCRNPPATLKPKTQNYENKITLTRTQIGTEDHFSLRQAWRLAISNTLSALVTIRDR